MDTIKYTKLNFEGATYNNSDYLVGISFDGVIGWTSLDLYYNFKDVYWGWYIGASPTNKIPHNLVIPGYIKGSESAAIKESGFENNTTITNVTIPNTIRRFCTKAFQNCTNLQELVFAQNSKLHTLESSCMRGCSNLKSVHLPKSLKTIQSNVFTDSPNITHIYYEGTPDDWSGITIYDTANVPMDAVHYFSESKPAEYGKYWHYVDGVPTIWVPEVYNLTITIDSTPYRQPGSGVIDVGKVATIYGTVASEISSIETLTYTVYSSTTYDGRLNIGLGTYENAQCTLDEDSSVAGKYILTVSKATGNVSVNIKAV